MQAGPRTGRGNGGRAAIALAVLLALALPLLVPAAAAKGVPAPADVRDGAVLHLLEWRGHDGRFPAGLAPYVVEAVAAAGLDPAQWPDPSTPVLADVVMPPSGNGNDDGNGTNESLLDLLRPAHALAVAGRREGLADRILAHFSEGQFGEPRLLNDDAWAILALRAAGLPANDSRLQSSASHLLANGHADGGWPWTVGSVPDTDTTGMAVAALDAVGRIDAAAALSARLAFDLARAQGGGWAETPGAESNCDSSVWAMRGLALLGLEPPPGSWDYLLSLRHPTGGFAWRSGLPPNGLCTAEAVVLLSLALDGEVGLAEWPEEAPQGKDSAGFGAAILPATLAACAVWARGRGSRHAP